MNVLVVIMMVAGVIQPNRMEIQAQRGDCMAEIVVVQAINRVNRAAGVDTQYLVSCENR
jgi:hypothetical protein